MRSPAGSHPHASDAEWTYTWSDTAYQATPLTWAEYYLREVKSDNPAKQYAVIVNYLREKGRNE